MSLFPSCFMTSRPSIATLPTELLVEINLLLDVPSLFSLARTNRLFNELAIRELAPRRIGISYTPGIRWLRLDLSSLNASSLRVIIVPRTISYLWVQFPPSLHQYRDQLSALQWAVSRDYTINTLRIDADLNPTTKFFSRHFITWWNALVAFIEAALARGCGSLELDLNIHNIPQAVRSVDRQKSKLQLSVINRCNSLWDCQLSGNLLCETPFTPWIIDLLSCSPIARLKFCREFRASKGWCRQFGNLRIPDMYSFITYSELPWNTLRQFLEHNRKLRYLTIVPNDVEHRGRVQGTIHGLRKLQRLDLHPIYAPCVLSDNQSRRQLEHCSLTLISDHSDDIKYVFAACATLSERGDLYHISELCLHFSTDSAVEALQTWLRKFHNQPTSPKPSFPRIKRLTLDLSKCNPESRHSSLTILKDFCALFIDLETVTLSDWDFKLNLNEQLIVPFWEDLVEVCPSFSTGLIGWFQIKQHFTKVKKMSPQP